jgi:DNA-binding CsgD family transcriptional regulator
MKRWRIPHSENPLMPAVVADVMAGIATPRLAAACLGALQRVLPVTFCTVYAATGSGRLVTVSAASSYGDTAERTAARYIAERFDRFDPHMVWLGARPLPRTAQRWLGHLEGHDIADAAYRAACYTEVGIRERASVLLLLPTGQRTAVSFYRSLAQPAFAAADFACLEQHAALLTDAAAAHGRCGAPSADADATPPWSQALLSLSQREREVIDHLLAGRTARATAAATGLALTTVRTHQYRAFRRLGIRSLKELLRPSGSPRTLGSV